MNGWSRTPIEDGVVMRAGDRWIRIRRVAPISVRALLDALLADASQIIYEPSRELVTAEGELAAIGGARCVSRGRELECTVTIVAGEPALAIEAIDARDEALALTRELGLGLGAARRRWFRYEPPPRWFGVRRNAATVWLHPDHPRVPAIATVFDARPFLPDEPDRFDRLVRNTMSDDFVARGGSTVTHLRSTFGLEGRQRTVAGTRRGRDVIRIALACADDRFEYTAHFEGDAMHAEAVRRMFDSFRPLPHAAVEHDAFAMWEA